VPENESDFARSEEVSSQADQAAVQVNENLPQTSLRVLLLRFASKTGRGEYACSLHADEECAISIPNPAQYHAMRS
jgi:hypothetical protein